MYLLNGHTFAGCEENSKTLTIFLSTCTASWENQQSAYAKTKAQISFAVTAKLVSAFVFATRIVHFPFFLNPKFQASSCLLWFYSPVCVGPVRKPHCLFSDEAAQLLSIMKELRTCLRTDKQPASGRQNKDKTATHVKLSCGRQFCRSR